MSRKAVGEHTKKLEKDYSVDDIKYALSVLQDKSFDTLKFKYKMLKNRRRRALDLLINNNHRVFSSLCDTDENVELVQLFINICKNIDPIDIYQNDCEVFRKVFIQKNMKIVDVLVKHALAKNHRLDINADEGAILRFFAYTGDVKGIRKLIDVSKQFNSHIDTHCKSSEAFYNAFKRGKKYLETMKLLIELDKPIAGTEEDEYYTMSYGKLNIHQNAACRIRDLVMYCDTECIEYYVKLCHNGYPRPKQCSPEENLVNLLVDIIIRYNLVNDSQDWPYIKNIKALLTLVDDTEYNMILKKLKLEPEWYLRNFLKLVNNTVPDHNTWYDTWDDTGTDTDNEQLDEKLDEKLDEQLNKQSLEKGLGDKDELQY